MTRTPFDGQPFYCVLCGDEYGNSECQSWCCDLESEAEAEARAWLHNNGGLPVLQPITVKVTRLSAPEFANVTDTEE